MYVELREIIRKNIRNRRTALNMPLDELADMVNLSAGYIGSIERGERTGTLETLCNIAQALNMSVNELFADNYPANRINPLLEKINGYLVHLDANDCEHLLDVCRFLKVKNDRQAECNRHKSP